MTPEMPPQLITITEANDPQIAGFAHMRDAARLKNSGLCLLEGKTVITHAALYSRFPITAVLIADNKIDDAAPLIKTLPAHIPIYVAARSLLQNLTGFDFHRGFLALAQNEPCDNKKPEEHQSKPLIGLSKLGNHDNIGSIFRSAAALGAGTIYMDAQTADPLYRKSIRVSSGTVLSHPFLKQGHIGEIIERKQQQGYTPIAFSPHGAHSLYAFDWPKRPLLVFGNEGLGLDADVLAKCTSVKLPMAQKVDSLNVATMASIGLFAYFQQRLK